MDPSREMVLRHLKQMLQALTCAAEVRILPEGLAKERATTLHWPPPVGLFGPWPDPLAKSPDATAGGEGCSTATLTITASRTERTPPEEGEGGSRYSADLAADILALLRETGRRFTGGGLADELARRHLTWGTSTVDHCAAAMRARGQLGNARDARGKGYGLPEWEAGQE